MHLQTEIAAADGKKQKKNRKGHGVKGQYKWPSKPKISIKR